MRPIFSAIEWLVHRDRSGPTMGSDIMYVPAWDRLLVPVHRPRRLEPDNRGVAMKTHPRTGLALASPDVTAMLTRQ